MNRQLYEYSPVAGYRFVPGIKARVPHEAGGYLVRVNQSGFRCNREFEARRTPGRRRILLFGDSYTAGDGVSNKQRYGDLLESLLPDLEVYNFGLSGTGTDQQYLIFRELAAGIEHDLILIGVLVENIRRVAARYRPYFTAQGEGLVLAKPYFTFSSEGCLQLHHVPVPEKPVDPEVLPPEERRHIDRGGDHAWLRQKVNALGARVKGLAQRVTRYQPVPEYNRSEGNEWQLMRAILERWAAEATAPLVVCPIPLYHHIEELASPRAYQARFLELARDTSIQVHDPLPDLLEYPASQRREFRFATDCHLSPAGHRALAESLAAGLRPLLPPAD